MTTVNVAKAQIGSVPITVDALGTVTPLANVTVRTRIAGVLEAVDFHEGQMVRKGQRLALVDPRPYQVAVDQAQGQLVHDQALLANARLDLKRYQDLWSENSISKQQVDTQAALVTQYEGTVKSDQANLANAKLNLAYCTITSPVEGRIGLRKVDPGNFVQTGDANGVVVVTTIAPIDVQFALPEDYLPQLQSRLRSGARLPVTAYDRARTNAIAQGTFLTLDNVVDTTTGTIHAKARFANGDNALYPNQFVNVRVLLDTMSNVVTIPTSAVRHGAPGDFVYAVTPQKTAKVVVVKLGPQAGETIAILSGLNPGDTVVTEGGDRLRDGAPVLLPGDKPRGGGSGRKGQWSGQGGGQWGGQGGGAAASGQGAPASTGDQAAPQGGGQHHWNGGQGGNGQGWQGHGGSGRGHWNGQRNGQGQQGGGSGGDGQ
jgi:multidrug efflux system membrane fusion protein